MSDIDLIFLLGFEGNTYVDLLVSESAAKGDKSAVSGVSDIVACNLNARRSGAFGGFRGGRCCCPGRWWRGCWWCGGGIIGGGGRVQGTSAGRIHHGEQLERSELPGGKPD